MIPDDIESTVAHTPSGGAYRQAAPANGGPDR
jgi:hypothetical protein